MGLERTNNGRSDLRSEYCRYQDDGCEFAESCLNCPLPVCIYEESGGKRRFLKRQRDKEMARLHANEGKGVSELAQIFGVSKRTVQRALKGVLSDSEGGARK
jgi:hypothetical protein